MILVGKIINTHGLKGFVKIKPFTDFPERFFPKAKVFMEDELGKYKSFTISDSFEKGNCVVVKFKGFEDINEIESFIDKKLFIKEKDLKVLPEDTYYMHDLIGLDILDENEKKIGVLCDILQLSSNDIYEARGLDGKKFLIPALKHFIEKIDIEQRILKLKSVDGILD